MTMTNGTFARLAGASLIVATSMVGCSGARMEQRPALATNQAAGIAAGIERALVGRDYARALLDAERLVEATPREASARTLLGRAYLANGRYGSARTAFEDALTLGATDPRTLVSLALVRTAMGDPEGARALISAHIETLPASDYGLAMAMAGDPREGTRALMQAAMAPDAEPQTRQNFAYALALAGEWGQARLVAGQDLTGSQLQQRLAQWAASAQPEAYPQRISAFLGVNPRGDDAGLPARLALAASEPTSLAEAQPMEPSQMAAEAAQDTRPVEMATADPMAPDAPVDAAFTPTPDAVPVPLIRASTDPMRAAVMQHLARPMPAVGKARAVSTALHGGSDWVVQIGAFNSDKVASSAWSRVKGKAFEDRGYRKITGTVRLNGQTYHRLAMSGFDSRASAMDLCTALRSRGQSCFVRRDEGVANDIRMARAGKDARPEKAASLSRPRTIASR